MNVLVTGGAGYIGSHAVRELLGAGHAVTVLDDLSNGHRAAVDPRAELIEGTTANAEVLRWIFKERATAAVVHFAANIEVGESVTDPFKYYANNFSNGLNLLREMASAGVAKIVFSSTAAVYGAPRETPIAESAPREPINPYGRSKLMMEMALEDFARAHGLGYVILRYFNVAGAHPSGEIGEAHQPESHLIPLILRAAANSGGPLKIFGTDYPTRDGTCVRDYVHVVDLARAHVLALAAAVPGEGRIYNLGSEEGFTVREVLTACEKVTGRPIDAREEGRRAGDPPTLVASSRKIREELNWQRIYPDIETIVAHAWNWHRKNPLGFHAG